jgi:hypothetical protein
MRSPASAVLWGAPTSCRPSHPPSFPSLGLTNTAHFRALGWGRQDLPGSWTTLVCTCLALPPRWGAEPCPGPLSSSVLPLCSALLPSALGGTSAHTTIRISGPNHAACTLAVYASQTPSRTPTQDSLPAGGTTLAGRDLHPVGCEQRFQIIFLLCQAYLAHAKSRFISRRGIANSMAREARHRVALQCREGLLQPGSWPRARA